LFNGGAELQPASFKGTRFDWGGEKKKQCSISSCIRILNPLSPEEKPMRWRGAAPRRKRYFKNKSSCRGRKVGEGSIKNRELSCRRRAGSQRKFSLQSPRVGINFQRRRKRSKRIKGY